MNVDDPKLTAYALNELDEPERSAIAQSIAESPEAERFVGEIQELASVLRSQYRLELQRELIAPRTLTAIQGDGFWSNAGPLAVAALIALFAVVGAVMFSSYQPRVASVSRSSLPRALAESGTQSNQLAPVEAEETARSEQNQNLEADAGPYAFTGERPFVSVTSRPRSSVPLIVNSASYLDIRRSIDAGSLPPQDSVRIEEMINHFSYDYPPPSAGEPFSLSLDVVSCPWEAKHRLVRVGLKANQPMAVRADSRVEVEFNPHRVQAYRLIGYDRQKTETRNSDRENASSRSVASGYTLTTLYEVVPLKRLRTMPDSQSARATTDASEPLLSAKLQPNPRANDTASGLIQRTVTDTGFDFAAASSDMKFAAAVAEFGLILRGSEYKGNGSLQQVIEWAQQGMGADVNGYRADFIELVRKTQALKRG
jgi:hypothetical protein